MNHISKLIVGQRKDTKQPTWFYRFEGKNINCHRERIYKSGFLTEKEASLAGNQAYCDYYSYGRDSIRVSKFSFRQYVEQLWLPEARERCKSITVLKYQKVLTSMVYPAIGSSKLSDINTRMLQLFFNNLYLHTETSVHSIDDCKSLVSQIFKQAVNNHFLSESPMTAVYKPNPQKIGCSCVKRVQVRDNVPDEIIEAIIRRFPENTSCYLALNLCLYLGLRKHEAFALAWQDIDFEHHYAYVTRQFEERTPHTVLPNTLVDILKSQPKLENYRFLTQNPKYNSKRIVPMCPELEAILRRAKEQQAQNRKTYGRQYTRYSYTRRTDPCFDTRTFASFNEIRGRAGYLPPESFEDGIVNTVGIGYPIDFINVSENGSLINPGSTQWLSRVIQGKEGEPAIYPHFNMHSLRNTFASKMRERGIPTEMVSAMMGHKDEKTTQVYMSTTEQQFHDAMSCIRGKESRVDAIALELSRLNLSPEELDALLHKCSEKQPSNL